GFDPINTPIFFSVDRVAVGLPGSAVFTDAAPGSENAAGRIYVTQPPQNSNALYLDEKSMRLQSGFFGDDVDGIELDTDPNHEGKGIYFSIDQLSASNGFGAGSLADDIFLNSLLTPFAEGTTDIGL